MAASLNVTFTDGSKQSFRIGPKALLDVEDELGPDARNKPMRATFVAGWKASKSPLPFDEWLDTIDEFSEDTGTVDPTVPAPSPDVSPT